MTTHTIPPHGIRHKDAYHPPRADDLAPLLDPEGVVEERQQGRRAYVLELQASIGLKLAATAIEPVLAREFAGHAQTFAKDAALFILSQIPPLTRCEDILAALSDQPIRRRVR